MVLPLFPLLSPYSGENEMNGYVLQHIETGKYVAPSGSEQSYTSDLASAQVYRTRDAAEKDRCVESNRVVPLAVIFAVNGEPAQRLHL